MFDSVRSPAVWAAATVIVLVPELNPNGVVVPRSFATTTKVCVPWAGMFAVNARVPAVWLVRELTTYPVPVLIRLTVNDEPVPVRTVLYVTDWPASRRTFVGTGVETVGAALTVIELDVLHTTFAVVAESTLLNEYVVVEDGLTNSVVPDPMFVPPHPAALNQL